MIDNVVSGIYTVNIITKKDKFNSENLFKL